MAFLTPIAITKFRGLFENPKAFETSKEHRNDTRVCTMNIMGMIARSASLFVVS